MEDIRSRIHFQFHGGTIAFEVKTTDIHEQRRDKESLQRTETPRRLRLNDNGLAGHGRAAKSERRSDHSPPIQRDIFGIRRNFAVARVEKADFGQHRILCVDRTIGMKQAFGFKAKFTGDFARITGIGGDAGAAGHCHIEQLKQYFIGHGWSNWL
ncbi:hypothetical protein [uncultured Rhodoblastus sp.]|uniref:hypothetical protein n=1 Tax=uncultured Rhodoblastus sp. TaxID=543037 RepID=UPI0025E8245E|nr:hypothetical protein [uncultured Rhodoblastus sp.]